MSEKECLILYRYEDGSPIGSRYPKPYDHDIKIGWDLYSTSIKLEKRKWFEKKSNGIDDFINNRYSIAEIIFDGSTWLYESHKRGSYITPGNPLGEAFARVRLLNNKEVISLYNFLQVNNIISDITKSYPNSEIIRYLISTKRDISLSKIIN